MRHDVLPRSLVIYAPIFRLYKDVSLQNRHTFPERTFLRTFDKVARIRAWSSSRDRNYMALIWRCGNHRHMYRHTYTHKPIYDPSSGLTWVSRWHHQQSFSFHVFASSRDKPSLFKSSETQSCRVFLGRPLCLVPAVDSNIQRLIQSVSFRISTCLNHLSLPFWLPGLSVLFPTSLSSPFYFISNRVYHTFFWLCSFPFSLALSRA